jgi:hypothetical protein
MMMMMMISSSSSSGEVGVEEDAGFVFVSF